VSVAAVYHSVQAFLPENPRRRWFTAARSHTCYEPDPSRYVGLKPPGPTEDGGGFDNVAHAARAAGLDLTAWIVLLHSSLATANPEFAARPLGGSPQPGVLCPANAAVAGYAVAVATEIDERFSPEALDLETVGWAALPHHHHAKVAVPLGPSGRYLSGLCFCDACRGLCSPDLPRWAARRLTEELRRTIEPVELATLLAESPELAAFQAAREGVLVELVRAIVDSVSARVHVAHWGEPRQAGLDHAAIAALADKLTVLDYGQGAETPGASIADAARLAGADRVIAGLSICDPETPTEESFAVRTAAVDALGITDVSIYHHSLADTARLRWAAC
jgi:hypothetical protein